MKKNIGTIIKMMVLLVLMSVCLSGCMASCDNTKALNGGVVGTTTSRYVVFNESGGTIMDCWILKDAYVESEESSDGLRFVDTDGNGIIVQGDAKIIRINNNNELSGYIEYHYEKDLIPYPEYYKLNKK